MVLPPEHAIESTRAAKATTTASYELHRVADRVTREMREVARRRGWVSTAPAEPPTRAAPPALFCGARPQDLARRFITGHSDLDRTTRTP